MVLAGRRAQAFDMAAMAFGQRVEQAPGGLVKPRVGHLRRQHDAHADFLIGAADRREPVHGWRRELEIHVVGRRAALQDHLRGVQKRGRPLVLEGEPGGHPGTRVEQKLQRPLVAQPFTEAAMAVRMGVDQSRDQQLVRRVHCDGAIRRRQSGRPHFAYCIVLDEYVGGRGPPLRHIEHEPAADDLKVG